MYHIRDPKSPMVKQKKIFIQCPTCHKKIEYSNTNPFRPFCSERCQLIDLGAWANEDYKIPYMQEKQEEDETKT